MLHSRCFSERGIDFWQFGSLASTSAIRSAIFVKVRRSGHRKAKSSPFKQESMNWAPDLGQKLQPTRNKQPCYIDRRQLRSSHFHSR